MTDVHYFSNGTEGEIWASAWCNNCTAEHEVHEGADPSEKGCPILLALYTGAQHEALVVDDRWVLDPSMRVRCSAYKPCTCPIDAQQPDVPLTALERRIKAIEASGARKKLLFDKVEKKFLAPPGGKE